MSDSRGTIAYHDRAQQINDFHGLLRKRNITPTDIDGMIDYNGKAFIFFEGKYGDKEMDYGQRLAFENLCKALNCPYLIIRYNHNVNNTNVDVDVAKQLVIRYYENGRWKAVKGAATVLEFVESFEQKYKHLDL